MALLRTVLLQIAPCGTLEDNLKKGIESCKKSKEMGAHMVLFPEMWSCGYDIGGRPYEEWKKDADLAPGEDFWVADLDTPLGPVKTGTMICYDREFPESARILMLKGAELILVPNACPMEINRLSQLRAGAEEGIFLADIDLSVLRIYRESEVHGNAYRRPEKYGLLTSRDRDIEES